MTMRDSKRARRVAIALLDWYPRPWRRRYAAEMRALLDEMPVSSRQAADLAVGAVREWFSPRALGWPARSAAGRVQVVRGLKFTAAVAAFEVVAHLTITPTSPATQAMPWLAPADIVVNILWIARLIAAGFAWKGWPRWVARRGWFGALGTIETAFWFAAVLIADVAARHAEPIPSWVREPGFHVFMEHLRPFLHVYWIFIFSARSKRLGRVVSSHLKRRTGAMARGL
jgi:hypothetical protein